MIERYYQSEKSFPKFPASFVDDIADCLGFRAVRDARFCSGNGGVILEVERNDNFNLSVADLTRLAEFFKTTPDLVFVTGIEKNIALIEIVEQNAFTYEYVLQVVPVRPVADIIESPNFEGWGIAVESVPYDGPWPYR